jgi:hypothetical protein
MSVSTTATQFASYEQGFNSITGASRVNSDRDLIASVLLDAVEQSFAAHEHKARRWLGGIYAQSLMLLLDISPAAALEHLQRKWRKIDAEAATPAPGQPIH